MSGAGDEESELSESSSPSSVFGAESPLPSLVGKPSSSSSESPAWTESHARGVSGVARMKVDMRSRWVFARGCSAGESASMSTCLIFAGVYGACASVWEAMIAGEEVVKGAQVVGGEDCSEVFIEVVVDMTFWDLA